MSLRGFVNSPTLAFFPFFFFILTQGHFPIVLEKEGREREERKREWERRRRRTLVGCLLHILTGDRTRKLFVYRKMLHPTEPHWPGPPTLAFNICVHICIFLGVGLSLSKGSLIQSLTDTTNIPPALAAWFRYIEEKRERGKKSKNKTAQGLSLGGGEKIHTY